MARTLRYAWNHDDDNVLRGNDRFWIDEEFRAGAGNDQVFAGAGDDLVLGQDGDDTLLGQSGSDDVRGGDGNDTLSGGEARFDDFDILDGGAGNDTLHFSGEDSYNGGTGTDTFDAHQLDLIPFLDTDGTLVSESLGPKEIHGIRMDLNAGIAAFRGDGSASGENFYSDGNFVGQTMGTSRATFSSIEVYSLTNFGDYFEGDSTSDTINGFGGNDVIEGKGGADFINGGSENDTIEIGRAHV